MKRFVKKYRLPLAAAVLLVLSALCFLAYRSCGAKLLSQSAAERWRGENELAFAQVSCFMPESAALGEEQIYKFRTDMAAKLREASLEVGADGSLIHDAWSAFGKVKISQGRRNAEVSAVAVGGSFFDFHPLTLVSGTYLSPGDLMKDRVLLDRDCAWLLFGSDDVAGMDFEINGQPFVVAGVIEREDDRFSSKAYTEGMGVYMSYEAYSRLYESAPVACYELVMAEPVEGFVYRAAMDKFPIANGSIVDNSARFKVAQVLELLGQPRSMQLGAAVYPYWENAARAAEDACLKWLVAAMALALLPLLMLIFYGLKFFAFGKAKLEDDFIPAATEKVSEAWRAQARKRWEKRNQRR